MPSKNTINFSTILKRSTCLNSTSQLNESTYSDELFDRALNAVEKTKDGKDFATNSSVNSFVESISNKESAAKFYWQPFKILSEMNKKDLASNADLLSHKYVTKILPYVEDLDMVQGDIDRFTLTEAQSQYINDSINKFKIADRILSNYNSLSKRFNLENPVIRYASGNLKHFVESIANMVDTYNTKNYQKMNIVLEEVDYILSKEGLKYDKKDMVKCVVEHYLCISPYLSDKDLENYRRTLKESYVLNDSDLDSVKFIFEGVGNVNSIDSAIKNFLLLKNKTPEILAESITNVLEKTTADDIVYNSPQITDLLWELTKNEVFEDEDAVLPCASIVANYVYECACSNDKFCEEDVNDLITRNYQVKDQIHIDFSNPAKYSEKFIENVQNSVYPTLCDASSLIYNRSNLEAIDYLHRENPVVLPLKEFKIFKFHNLIRAAFNLDKFLKVKEKRLIDNGKNKVSKFMKKAKNVLFGEAANEQEMLEYIGDDGRANLTVRQYFFDENFDSPADHADLNEVKMFLTEVCKDFNDILISQNETCRAYYVINPGIAEIKIGEQTKTDISNVDVYQSLDESFETYLEILEESLVDDVDCGTFRDIYDDIEMMKESSSFSLEQFELALEAMSLIGTEKSKVELFANEFVDFNFDNAIVSRQINESYGNLSKLEAKVKALVEAWEPVEEVSLADKMQAYQYLQSIFEYSFPTSSDDDEDDEDDDEEEEKKSSKPEVKKPKVGGSVEKKDEKKEEASKDIDDVKIPTSKATDKNKAQKILTDIKLGLNGLKTKYKDLNTKYKEACRNLDNAGRAFATATKNALVSDSREAIIKGQVVPSFSRCIKASIILAGVAAFSLPAAVIGAIGALAISHKLTKTERLLLLDEIETELEVVDKELQIADSNNQINKYRELLKIKKNLQRQYQRIKYNVRVGKDILPGSAVGVPNSAD